MVLLSAVGSLGILLPDALKAEHEADGPPPPDIVSGPKRPRWFALAGAVTLSFVLVPALAGALPASLTTVARAAGTTLLTMLVATGCALSVAAVLGLLAGGISRAAGTFLSRANEITCALPQPLITCAAFSFGAVTGAALLGVLRGVEVGHWLRVHITERRVAEEVEPPSLGRAPFSPYFKRVLPAAIGPSALSLALTLPWLAALEGAGAELGAPTSNSLSALAMGPGATGLAALALLALLAGSFAWLVRDVSPRPSDDETPGAPVVLALKRRVDSVRPPKSEPET
jgi:hypothetical protein